MSLHVVLIFLFLWSESRLVFRDETKIFIRCSDKLELVLASCALLLLLFFV